MPGLTDGEPRSRLDDTDDESDLVYHVVCSRDRPDGAPMAPLRAGEAWWLSRDHETPRTPRDAVALRDRAAADGRVQPGRRAVIAARSTRAPNELLAHDIDVVDRTEARAPLRSCSGCRLLWRSTFSVARAPHCGALYGFAGLASVCFIAYGDLPGWDLMIYPVLGVHGCRASARICCTSRGGWQRRYHDYRVLAEALRVQFYWAIAGVERPAVSRFGHDAFLKRQDLELGWIRNMLRVAGQRDDATEDDAVRSRCRDCRARLGRRRQLNYYPAALAAVAQVAPLYRDAGSHVVRGGIAVGRYGLRSRNSLFERQPTNVLIALMGVLPVVATLRQHFSHCEPRKAN